MAFEIKGITGTNPYIWYQLARGTAAGHSVEYEQFMERFLQGNDITPNNDEGVQGSFYVNLNQSTLFYKQDNNNNNDSWIRIAGGSSLEIFDETTSLTTAATSITFVGDGVTASEPTNNQVTVTIPGGGGGSALTVSDNDSSVTDVSEINFEDAYFTVTTGDTATTATVAISDVVADGASGLMTGADKGILDNLNTCLLYTSPSPRDRQKSRMPSSA